MKGDEIRVHAQLAEGTSAPAEQQMTCLEMWTALPYLFMVHESCQAADSVHVVGCTLHGRALLQQLIQNAGHLAWNCA